MHVPTPVKMMAIKEKNELKEADEVSLELTK